MRAAVIYEPGDPEVLKLEDLPIPTPKTGEVLIRIKAFGLNRSELFTRQGHSPSVEFPRVLGIEAVGEVVAAPGTDFSEGTTVATAMGGMGRQFNGSYAEYACVPASHIKVLPPSRLTWETLGALPEMLQTAWGSLFSALRLKPENGADFVLIDDRAVAEQIKKQGLRLFDKVLELVGTGTLTDSLHCTTRQGSVCMTGMVGNEWTFEKFSPMDIIPHTVNLTIYSGGVEDFMATPYKELIPQVEEGILEVRLGKTFHLEEIVEAHRCLEAGSAGGKIVVLTT
ncbi:zinc-binding oxidoreductase [Talaromyces pinophilus]|uniref:Zinc-binding oxidoreductase n=1 Tax=Talaromyces pinophilus TaxID=128442 RepID=A0A510NX72_TALPI|nr:zinc-binding oxidoreductase [Talaromyces pinophilus]